MTQKETLIKLIKSFKNHIWNIKFNFIVIIWLLTTILWAFEPFFSAKLIWFIEIYFKTGVFNTETLIIFFSLWMSFIVIHPIIRYIFRYFCLDKNALDFYMYQAEVFKEKALRMTEFEYLWQKPWKLFKIFDRWLESTFFILFAIFFDIYPALINIIFVSILIIVINPILALATLIFIPIFIFMWWFFNVKTRILQTNVNKIWDEFYAKLWDAITNLTLVKTLTFEKNILKEMWDIANNWYKIQLPISKRWSIADIYVSFLINIVRLTVIFTWIFLIKNWNLDLATLFLFFSYIWYIYNPINNIFSQLKNLQKHLEDIKKFYTTFENIPQDNDLETAKDIESLAWNIEFKNVNFCYIPGKTVLNNINLEIKSWEKVALVWSTWSWKTTISKILLRLFEINSWEILVNLNNIKDIKKSSLRKHIWIVMQDSSLFNTSILENMKYAKTDASLEEIETALKKAKADFIFKTEAWLETLIWERWLKLSGWEKQRINIARIMLKNPEILILDEATSALDNKTEIEIQQSLDALMEGKTSIIIAHRLSTIKKADRIFVLDNWEIVESGNYEELLEKKWFFYNLANPDKLILS